MTLAETVGVVGVGTVGGYFVEKLRHADVETVAYDVDAERRDWAADRGATVASGPGDVAREADVVALSLPGATYVESVMGGHDGILAALSDGQVVVDTGTTRPDLDARYAAACADRGAAYLDGPLTWGGPGEYSEETGPAFTMFVGGDADAYVRVTPVLDVLAHTHRRFGGPGSGHVVKLAHRAHQNCTAMVDAEMVEFFRNNGVDPAQVEALMEWGLRDRLFEENYPSVAGYEAVVDDAAGDATGRSGPPGLDPGYRIDDRGRRPALRTSEWAKDPLYALAVAHSSNTATPILSAALQVQLSAENYGEALLDREIGYKDSEWSDRSDVITTFRRENRPAEEWRRRQRQARED